MYFTECWTVYWSGMHGLGSLHHNQRPLHAGQSALWRIPLHVNTTLDGMDALFLPGSLRLSKYADCRVQSELTRQVCRDVVNQIRARFVLAFHCTTVKVNIWRHVVKIAYDYLTTGTRGGRVLFTFFFLISHFNYVLQLCR